MDHMQILLQQNFNYKLPLDCLVQFPALTILQPQGSFQLSDFDGGIRSYIQGPKPWIHTPGWAPPGAFEKTDKASMPSEPSSPGAPSNDMDRLQSQVISILFECGDAADAPQRLESFSRKVIVFRGILSS